MKRGKNLIGWAIAVILCLSLILVPVVGRVSPVQAAVTWTKYSGEVTLDSELYVVDAWVIRDGSTYEMWYTHGETDLGALGIVSAIENILTDDIINDIANLDLDQFLNHLVGLDVDELKALLDGTGTVIGYATSANGNTWTKVNSEVLAGSGAAWDSVGAPCVIWDATDNKYKMWYTHVKTDYANFRDILTDLGTPADRRDAILALLDTTTTVIEYTTSSDGVDWGAPQQVLAGSGPAWDSVADPCVIRNSASDYEMWYTRAKTDLNRTELDDILDAIDVGDFHIAHLAGVHAQ